MLLERVNSARITQGAGRQYQLSATRLVKRNFPISNLNPFRIVYSHVVLIQPNQSGTIFSPRIFLYVSIKSPVILLLSKRVNPSYFSLSSYPKWSMPCTSFVAHCCIPSINLGLMSLLYGRAHIWQQYSKCGRTKLLYNVNVDVITTKAVECINKKWIMKKVWMTENYY